MDSQVKRNAKLNIIMSLIFQIITILCGLIVPRTLIAKFGSEAYGATASITQFLAYIALLEGGIGGVARAALYKPLAEKDNETVSRVVYEIKKFFKIVAYIFIVYVIILAVFFKNISNIQCLNWISTFWLVIVMSISIFAQYFIGISYAVLLQASQKTYINQVASIFTTILNAILVVLLTRLNCNLIIVKLVSGIVFTLRPVFMWLYVKKNYNLTKVKVEENSKPILTQKLTGLSQHIAYFLHSNTDVAVLTLLANLSMVAVYSVYQMVVNSIQNFVTAFSSGMEAIFGDLIAKKEIKKLNMIFGYYETLITFISVILFSVTTVMIIPFVKIYTRNVTDVNYIYPAFAILLTISAYLYCYRVPYHSTVIAAGHFKQTRMAAYGEALVNIVLSIILVLKYKLIGVAIGTVAAVLFRFIYYVWYLDKNIINRKISLFVKRFIVNNVAFLLICLLGSWIVSNMIITGYVKWAIAGAVVSVLACIIEVVMMSIFYKKDLISLISKVLKKDKGANING